jgi:hypothetical protein
MARTTPAASTAVALIERDNLPGLAADVADVIGALADNLGGEAVGVNDFTRIRMPAGGGIAWEVPNLDGEADVQKVIRGVIVYQRTPRTYWATSFENSEGGPPDCRSDDGVTGRGNPGGDCSTCPLAQFGSGRGNTQACAQQRQIFVLREDGGAFPVILTLPPTSLKNARGYLVALAERGKKFRHVLTEIGLERATSNDGIGYSRATFRYVGDLSADAKAASDAYAREIGPLIVHVPADPRPSADGDVYEQGVE